MHYLFPRRISPNDSYYLILTRGTTVEMTATYDVTYPFHSAYIVAGTISITNGQLTVNTPGNDYYPFTSGGSVFVNVYIRSTRFEARRAGTRARTSLMADTSATTSPAEVSGATSWALEHCVNGMMRSWIDLDSSCTGGVDGMLWTASLILLRHLEITHPVGWWRGKRVLELGSGSGHMAVGLSKLGASVIATESAKGTGFDSMVAWTTYLLGTREASVGLGGGSVEFRSLHWSMDVEPADWGGFDVVILSELYYDPDLHEVLLHTLRSVLRPGMVAYSIFCDRPFSLGFLTMLHDDGTFLVTPIEPKEHFHLHEEEIVYTHEFARVTDVVAAGHPV
jgi:SAM-dependent methyltransferase